MKTTEELQFNIKRSCGLWLILIGPVLNISIIFGGDFLVNPFIFLIGYYVCFYFANINKHIRARLSYGEVSKFQRKMIFISLIALFVLMFGIAGAFIPGWHWRMIWLGVLLATGIHFFLLFFVHGKSMVFLGIVCILIAVSGYIFRDVPFAFFGTADGIVKILFGLYLLFFSKPTSFTPKRKD